MQSSNVALSQLGLLGKSHRPKVPVPLIEQPASVTTTMATESASHLMEYDRIDD